MLKFSGMSEDQKAENMPSSDSDRLVVDLEHQSESSKSSVSTVLNSSDERMLLQETVWANRYVPQRECPITRLAKKPRKVFYIPFNATSEHLAEECTVDDNGDRWWSEDPEDQTRCGHCGQPLLEHETQTVIWPCWHRVHIECQRLFKIRHWNELILWCPYKVCGRPMVDDADDLFNREQLFFTEMAHWRIMATFEQVLRMSHEEHRDMEAVAHAYRIRYGWKLDPTYLYHYRPYLLNTPGAIVNMARYRLDLPRHLSEIKEKLNRRPFSNGTEFVYDPNHATEKLPLHKYEYDFCEVAHLGFFRNYETDENVKRRCWQKIGQALCEGKTEVDFLEWNFKLEFKSQRCITVNFDRNEEGELIPDDSFTDFDEDSEEGRQDGRARLRPPTQNDFHTDIARNGHHDDSDDGDDGEDGDDEEEDPQVDSHKVKMIDCKNVQSTLKFVPHPAFTFDVPDVIGIDPLVNDYGLTEGNPWKDFYDRMRREENKGSNLDKCLQTMEEELERDIQEIEQRFVDKNLVNEVKRVLKVMKDKGNQTLCIGTKNVGVQADELPFDDRSPIVDYIEYEFSNKLLFAERGWYDAGELKFILKTCHAVQELKERIFGFQDQPKVLVPKRFGDIDIDLATVAGFNIVHDGSYQFVGLEDPDRNPDCDRTSVLSKNDSSNDEETLVENCSFNAVCGDNEKSLGFSSSGSLEVLETSINKVKMKFQFRMKGLGSNTFTFRNAGLCLKTDPAAKRLLHEDSASMKRCVTPHQFHSCRPCKTLALLETEKRILPFVKISTEVWLWLSPIRLGGRRYLTRLRKGIPITQISVTPIAIVCAMPALADAVAACRRMISLSKNPSEQIFRKSNEFSHRIFKSFDKIFLYITFWCSQPCLRLCLRTCLHKGLEACLLLVVPNKANIFSVPNGVFDMDVGYKIPFLVILSRQIRVCFVRSKSKKHCFILFHVCRALAQFISRTSYEKSIYVDIKRTNISSCITFILLLTPLPRYLFIMLPHELVELAKFSVIDERGGRHHLVTLKNSRISFPPLHFNFMEREKGQLKGVVCLLKRKKFKIEITFAVLLLNVSDFDGLFLPQLVLIHILCALGDRLTFSSIAKTTADWPNLPRWFGATERTEPSPPYITLDGHLEVEIIRVPPSNIMRALFCDASNFFVETFAHVKFVGQLDAYHVGTLCTFLKLSHDTRATYNEFSKGLDASSQERAFVNFVSECLDLMDRAFYRMIGWNYEQFEPYFMGDLLGHLGQRSVPPLALLRTMRPMAANNQRRMFETALAKLARNWH